MKKMNEDLAYLRRKYHSMKMDYVLFRETLHCVSYKTQYGKNNFKRARKPS